MSSARPRLCFVVESGTDVRLVEGLARMSELQILARRIGGSGAEISQPTRAAFEMRVGPQGRLAFGRLVYSHLRRAAERVDVVLVQGYGVAALCANLAARATRVPTAMIVCSPIEAYYDCRLADGGRTYRSVEARGLRWLARLNARVAGRYVVLGPYLESVVRSHGGTAPIDVIPVYGVDTSIFKPACEDRASLRQRLGLPPNASLALFSSRIAPEKDADVLLEAVRRLRHAGRDLRIVHFSGGHREFVARARQLGVAEAVIAGEAVPPFERLAAYYQACDVCVQASRAEGLGFSVLEALACERPVVAADVGGLRDTIVEGETGWRYIVGDAQDLARAVADALDRPDEARRRAERGRLMVAGRYERDAVFDGLSGLFARLTMTSRAEPPAA